MTDPGPNYPAIIRRSKDDVAEALTAAEQRGWTIMQSVGKETFDEMFRRITAHRQSAD